MYSKCKWRLATKLKQLALYFLVSAAPILEWSCRSQPEVIIGIDHWDFITHQHLMNALRQSDIPHGACPRGGMSIALCDVDRGLTWLERDTKDWCYSVVLSSGKKVGELPEIRTVKLGEGIPYEDLVRLAEYPEDSIIGKVLRDWRFRNTIQVYPDAVIIEVRTIQRIYLGKSGPAQGWEVGVVFRDRKRGGAYTGRSSFQVLEDGIVTSGREF